MKNALHSLYGEGHADASRVGEGLRNQSIITPQTVVDGLALMWPEYPAMDPCSCPGQLVRAHLYPVDGLAVDWPEKTFCNPPYGTLSKWLEHGGSFSEVIWLTPVRTHRVWFRRWWHKLDKRLGLNPLTFVGYEQDYPAPLMLGYKGKRIDEFIAAFEHLGSEI